MAKLRTTLIGAGAIVGMLGGGAVSAATLDIRTGLWEVTSSGQSSGAAPIPADTLAKLPPEKRAQIEAAMQAAMAQSNQTRVDKSCLTDKVLQRGLDSNTVDRPNCTRTVTSSTSSLLDVREVCTGDPKMTGTFRFQAIDRQTLKGDINVVSTDGSHTVTIRRSLQGKWLGTDCGTVKPKE